MPLNEATGNMYPRELVSHTFNAIRGECYYRKECGYCYVPHTRAARFYEGAPRLIDKELKTNLYKFGKGIKIFVESMGDMWHDKIPAGWIYGVLCHCNEYPDNEYLFQSKNPKRFLEFAKEFPPHTMLATTIEGTTDLDTDHIHFYRAFHLARIKKKIGCKTLVSVEPIKKFNLICLASKIIYVAKPDIVTIGADSKNHGLPEPTVNEIQELIDWLKKEGYRVILKENLRRIMKGGG